MFGNNIVDSPKSQSVSFNLGKLYSAESTQSLLAKWAKSSNERPYNAVRHLASAIFPFSDKDKYMLMLTGYFDETGSEPNLNSSVAGIAGCLATAEAWEQFEIDWLNTLELFDVKSPFHMNEFAHSTKQFASWKGDKQRREAFYNSLWDAIELLSPAFIGCFVPLEKYRQLLTNEQRKNLMGVYQQCYVSCVAAIFELVIKGSKIGLDAKVRMVFEYKDKIQKDSYEIYNEIMKMSNNAFDGIISPPNFVKKDEIVSLQTADILAYECNKEFRRRLDNLNYLPRAGFQRIQKIADKIGGRSINLGEVDSYIIFHPPEFVDSLLKTFSGFAPKMR